MLIPVLSKLSINALNTAIIVKDSTGAYNGSTNPGGYGSPNIASPPGAVGFTFTLWGETVPYSNFATNNSSLITDLLGANGREFSYATLGLSAAFATGVHTIKYYPFEEVDVTVTATKDSKEVTVTADGGNIVGNLNTGYKAVIFLTTVNDIASVPLSNVYLLDRDTDWDAGTFLLQKDYAGTTQAGIGVAFATEADLKVLFSNVAAGCITGKIGKIDISNCECTCNEYLNKLLLLIGWLKGAEVKFQYMDYEGADILIKQVDAECNDCDIQKCKTCS